MATKVTTVDEYIEGLSPAARERIVKLRALINQTAPQLSEAIKWGSPAFMHPDGVIMLVISAHKTHSNTTFTPSTAKHFTEKLTDFETGKGSLKLPYTVDTPDALIREMIEYRIHEFENDGVKWM